MKLTWLLAFVIGLHCSFADTNTPVDKVVIPLDRKFAEQAQALDKKQLDFDQIFAQLSPAEQTRLLRLLLEEVTVLPDALELRLKPLGLTGLARELNPIEEPACA